MNKKAFLYSIPALLIPNSIHASSAEHTVSSSLTIFFTIILAIMILSLALEEKLHAKKSLIVGIFAMVTLFLGTFFHLLPFGPVTIPGGHELKMPIFIPGVDWEVIAIILGSSIFVDVTSKSGIFSFIAIYLTRASQGNPVKLLWFYGLMTVFFSAVLNNVTAMIIVGSLTGVSLSRLGRSDKLLGFLFIEALLTNVGGLLTLISSVPNIIVGQAAKISFMTFLFKASPFVLVATVLTILIGTKIFRIRGFQSEDERVSALELVVSFNPSDSIENKSFFWFSTFMLGGFIITIASTSFLPLIKDLGMGYVALSFALLMLIRFKSQVDEFYKAIDWDLIGFFVSLFVVINVLEHAKVLDFIGEGLALLIGTPGSLFGTGALLVSSAIFSSVTDNIPLAAMLAKILGGLDIASDSSLWWSVIFGANLGGNLTPIGSASTLVAVTIMHKYKLPMSFGGFIKTAAPFAFIQILIACLYVLLILS